MSEETRGPREVAYDEHIAPLMAQVLEACKKHSIPMVASFELDFEEEHGGALHCTSSLINDSQFKTSDNRLHRALDAIQPQKAVALAITQAPYHITVTRVA